jgi:small subunit ribosomal protein S1
MSFDPQHDEELNAIAASLEPDEGYWSALLEEGERAEPAPVTVEEEPLWDDSDTYSIANGYQPAVTVTNQSDWTLATTTYDQDETIDLNVTGFNRGGLLVSWNSLRGFVPASQLIDFPVDIDDYTRRELLSEYVDQTLTLRIIELDVTSNRLILSERAAQVKPGERDQVLERLEAGTSINGVVTNLCNFGAFVDLGGVEGLIHISELSWGRVGHPRDVLSSGTKVRVFIMSVDPEEERIALSLKRLQPDPWETVEQRYQLGQTVEGVITNVVDFGAFARIEDGLEGLVHISELAEGQFLHPRNVVQEGERVVAKILNIDGAKRRLGLSLRQAYGANNKPATRLNGHSANGHK